MTFQIVRPGQGLYLKDDFYSNDAVADAAVSELRWEIVTIGNASTYAFQAASAANGGRGILRSTTAATANGDGSVLRLFENGLLVALGSEITGRFRLVTTLGGNNVRIGLQDSVTATESGAGTWLNVAAGVVSVEADSTNGDNTEAVVRHPDLTGGTTLVVDTWYDFALRCSGRPNANGGPDEVTLELNGRQYKVRSLIGSAETVEFSITHWQNSGAGAARIAEFDYVDLWQPRIPV
jgi:hypothetical protein